MYNFLKKWTAASNYMGEHYPDYYVFLSRNRDSDTLDESNFEVGLERLGGESKTVIVVRSGHWAVGWVESILIHKSNKKALEAADEMLEDLSEYPILDESDYSEKEFNSLMEDINSWAYSDILSDLGIDEDDLNQDDEDKIKQALYYMLSKGSSNDPHYDVDDFMNIVQREFPSLYKKLERLASRGK